MEKLDVHSIGEFVAVQVSLDPRSRGFLRFDTAIKAAREYLKEHDYKCFWYASHDRVGDHVVRFSFQLGYGDSVPF